jgi:hypothetical protein
MQPVMIFLGAGEGWQCQLCEFRCPDKGKGIDEAAHHADRTHGAESFWSDELDIYNGKDPEVLRMTGRL